MKKFFAFLMLVILMNCGSPKNDEYFLHDCTLKSKNLYTTNPIRGYTCTAENRDNTSYAYDVYVVDHDPNQDFSIHVLDFYLKCEADEEEAEKYICTSLDLDNERFDFTLYISEKEAQPMNTYYEEEDETLAEIAYGNKD